MNAPSLVVSCTSPESAGQPELERWLHKATAALGPGRASVYRAFADPAAEGGDQAGDWLVVIYDDCVSSDSPHMAGLLTEMRLLGMRPAVYGSTSPRLIA